MFVKHRPVLDVGCGLGYFSDLLEERAIPSLGLDTDPEMVAATSARGHEAVQGDQRFLGRNGGRFGGIHVSHVVEHLWGDEVVELLQLAHTALTDDGLLVLRTPNWENPQIRRRVFWLDHTHRRPYGRELLEKLLQDVGFPAVAGGVEPYGLNDVYAVGAKAAYTTLESLRPRFGPDPFPKQPRQLFARAKGKLRQILRG